MKTFIYYLVAILIGAFVVYTAGNSMKESERCDLATQAETDSIENHYRLDLEKEIQLYRQAEDSVQLLIKLMHDTLAQKANNTLYFDAKELSLPKGEIVDIYPPKAKYRDLGKTKLYAVIRGENNASHIADLSIKQWLMLERGNVIK